MTKLKEYKKYYKYALIGLLGIIILSLILWDRTPKYSWPDGMIVPKPSSKYGEVEKKLSGEVNATIYKVDSKIYTSYVKELQKGGFSIDEEVTGNWFEAYNDKGYKVRVSYYDNSNEMRLYLEIPIKLSNEDISNVKYIDLVPSINSDKVNIINQSDKYFDIYVGDYNLKKYSNYVNECINLGYDVDYDKSEKYFSAFDTSGNKVIIKYVGFDIIKISFEKSKDNNSNSSNTGNSESEPNYDFKELMDKYEEFFDKYIDFMKKYNNTEEITLDMINEYSKYLSEYADYMDKLSKAQPKDLNSADYKYYMEVYTRIMKKIADM